jgi:hypothetical protein
MVEALRYKLFPLGETIMVKHGALSKSHVYKLLRSKDARVRRAAFTLLETSNPRLRRNSELFIGIARFIWDANPSYEVYQEFTKRHFQARYKVHELIGARLKIEKQEKQSAAVDDLADNTPQYEGGFFKRLFRRRSSCDWPRFLGYRSTNWTYSHSHAHSHDLFDPWSSIGGRWRRNGYRINDRGGCCRW